MALLHGNFPFGDPEIQFGSAGGTFGNLWLNGESKNDAVLAGGGDVDVLIATNVGVIDVIMGGNGDVDVTFIQVFRYFGSPITVVPVQAAGPTQARLQKAYAT